MIQSLPTRIQLAKAGSEPLFSVSVKNQQGKQMVLADPRATRALLACMDMEASLQGAASHWGGPSALAEIMSSVHALVFDQAKRLQEDWYEKFHLINDAGHCENGLYALKANYKMAGLTLKKLQGFRSINSPLTGHGETHLFPEGVYLSNGPLGSTLAQAQGLALADKLQNKDRLCIVTLSDGACMEGEVKESLAAIPGFAKKGKLAPFLLIISDNNTKLTGRIDENSFSMQPSLESLESLGWNVLHLKEGNDLQASLQACEQAIKEAKDNPNKPCCLWARTTKGYGVKATEEASSGGHGFPLKQASELPDFLKEIYKEARIPKEISNWCEDIQKRQKKSSKSSEKLEKVQKGISKALIEKKQEGLPIISVSADLQGSTGVADFQKKYPESFFDVGVAEANMVSVAAGLSKQGFIPVVDTFAQFGVTKGALPLMMASLSQAPVLAIFSHMGFQDAADGASHQALSYLAKTCSLPNTQVYCPSSSGEAYFLLSAVLEDFAKKRRSNKLPLSTIFFLGRETFPQHLISSPRYDLKQAQVLFENFQGKQPVCLVSFGPLLQQALQASEELEKKNQGLVVINNSLVSDPDISTISKYVKKCEGRLLVLEEHQVKGGFSSWLVFKLQEQGCKITKLKSLSVQGEVGRSAYQAEDLYKKFQLDKEAIKQACLEMCSS